MQQLKKRLMIHNGIFIYITLAVLVITFFFWFTTTKIALPGEDVSKMWFALIPISIMFLIFANSLREN